MRRIGNCGRTLRREDTGDNASESFSPHLFSPPTKNAETLKSSFKVFKSGVAEQPRALEDQLDRATAAPTASRTPSLNFLPYCSFYSQPRFEWARGRPDGIQFPSFSLLGSALLRAGGGRRRDASCQNRPRHPPRVLQVLPHKHCPISTAP